MDGHLIIRTSYPAQLREGERAPLPRAEEQGRRMRRAGFLLTNRLRCICQRMVCLQLAETHRRWKAFLERRTRQARPRKEEQMESIFILVLIVAVVCLDIATFLWGCDSRDGIDSPHWAQLQQWRALHEETTTRSKAWQPSRPGYQRPNKSDMEGKSF